MHFQRAPHTEIKMVRCLKGALYDVILDMRPFSPTFKEWIGISLNAHSKEMLYIPEGIAHGFQTLEDETELLYHISSAFVSEAAFGLRWDDPAFQIKWPLPVTVISEKDASYPDFI